MKMMTDQISSSVRKSSHAGMAEFQGPPSLGSPGPPFAIRQNTKGSTSCAMVSILDPAAGASEGFEHLLDPPLMPATFGDQLTGSQLEALVQFLANQR